jgi:hypothetical protein
LPPATHDVSPPVRRAAAPCSTQHTADPADLRGDAGSKVITRRAWRHQTRARMHRKGRVQVEVRSGTP